MNKFKSFNCYTTPKMNYDNCDSVMLTIDEAVRRKLPKCVSNYEKKTPHENEYHQWLKSNACKEDPIKTRDKIIAELERVELEKKTSIPNAPSELTNYFVAK